MELSLISSFIKLKCKPNQDIFYEENELKIDFLDKEISKLQSLVESLRFESVIKRKKDKIFHDASDIEMENAIKPEERIKNCHLNDLSYFKPKTTDELLSKLSASFTKNISTWSSNIASLKISYFNILSLKVFKEIGTYLKFFLNPELQEMLFNIILLSRERPELSIASSNAISILNLIGFSFTNKNLENINIPNADLSGSQLINTNFQSSNLNCVNFSHSNLFSINFDACNMENVTLEKGFLFQALEKRIKVITISPCQKYIVVNLWNEEFISIFSAQTKELIKTHQVETEIRSIAFSKCERYLALGLLNGKVILLDAKSINCQEKSIGVLINIICCDSFVIDLAFSRNSDFLAIFTNKDIKIWSLKEKQIYTSINTIEDPPSLIEFSPSENDLALLAYNGLLLIWRIQNPNLLEEKNIYSGEGRRKLIKKLVIGYAIKAFAYTPCSKYLIFGTSSSINMWNIAQQEEKILLKTEDFSNLSWVLAPDGKQIIYYIHSRIMILNIENQSSSFYCSTNYIKTQPMIKYLNLNKLILLIEELSVFAINVKDLENFKNFPGHICSVNNVSFSPCGKYILSKSDYGYVKKWNIKSKKVKVDYKITGWNFKSLKYSPCGYYLIADRLSRVAIFNENYQLMHYISTDPEYGVTALSNNGLLAIGGWKGNIKIFDISSKTIYLSRNTDNKDSISAIGFSPSNDLIGIGTFSGNIRIFLITNNLEFVYGNQINTYKIISLHFSPCKRYFAWTVETFKKIYILDLGIRSVRCFDGYKNSYYSLIRFSWCGNFVASINKKGNIHIWEVNQGYLIAELKGHLDIIKDFEFSRCGKWIATASLDKSVKLWNFEKIKSRVESRNNSEIHNKESFIEWSSINGDLVGSNISIREASISQENKEILNNFK